MATTVKDYGVNVADTQVLNFRIVETNAPRPPSSQLQYVIGQQIIAPLARGNLNGTAIQMSNLNFSHVCDFRYNIGFSLAGLLGIPDFANLIAQAIKNAKLKAAAKIRSAIQQAVDLLRTAINALIFSLAGDRSGQISFFVSFGKDLLMEINYYAKKIAQYIEDALVWIEVFKQINAMIQYIQSLPARIKAMVLSCISNFLNSVKNLANQVTNLPNTVLRQVQGVVASTESRATRALNQLTSEITNYAQASLSSDPYLNAQQARQRVAASNNQQYLTGNALSSYAAANSNQELVTLTTRDSSRIEQLNAQILQQSTDQFANSANSLTVTVPAAFSSANTKKP